jgi:hypothetical protein
MVKDKIQFYIAQAMMYYILDNSHSVDFLYRQFIAKTQRCGVLVEIFHFI